jgi:hypothetical protein
MRCAYASVVCACLKKRIRVGRLEVVTAAAMVNIYPYHTTAASGLDAVTRLGEYDGIRLVHASLLV